jgi:hypothetical protein
MELWNQKVDEMATKKYKQLMEIIWL